MQTNPAEPMQTQRSFSLADQIHLEELISFSFLVSSPQAMRIFVQRLQAFVPFTYYAFLLCPLGEDLMPKSLEWHLTNYPEQYAQNYLEEQAHFADLVVLTHFKKEGFGALQRWQDTYQRAQAQFERGEFPGDLYRKHLRFLEYVGEWGILSDGYSIGHQCSHPKTGEPLACIFSIADGLETGARTEKILTEIEPYLHQILVRIFLPLR